MNYKTLRHLLAPMTAASCAWLAGTAAWAQEPRPPQPRPAAASAPSVPSAPAASSAAGAGKPTAEPDRALPTDAVANAAIDTGFMRWSAAWMFDRYLPGSARATDRGLKDGTYVVRGVFDFARMGAKQTIPFAAAFTKRKDGQDGREAYQLSNLCYNDTTSGMTACIDPGDRRTLEQQQAAVMQSRQVLGSIVLLGMAAALSSGGEVCVRRVTFFGEEYFECD
jgi:hypothetical protein